MFLFPIFENFDKWGIHDWDQHQFYNGVPRKTILEYNQIPLWNPYYCGGNVMLANPQSGFLSPFYLTVLLFGVIHGLKINILFHLIFGMFGMYILSRHLKMGNMASYLPPFIFMLSGIFVSHMAVGHTNWLPMAFIPWVLYFSIKSVKKIKYFPLASIFLVLMIFGGATRVFPLTILFLLIYFVLESLRNRNFVYLKRFLLISCLTLFMASIKIFPVANLIKSDILDYNHSFGVTNIQGFDFNMLLNSLLNHTLVKDPFAFYFAGQTFQWHEYNAYIGIIALSLSCIGLLFAFRREWPLVITSFVFLLLSFGSNFVLNFFGIFGILPFFNTLHVPSRAIIIVIFCLSIFSGLFVSKLEYKKIGKLVLFILILIVFINLIMVNGKILDKPFVVEPSKLNISKKFYQEIDETKDPNLPGSYRTYSYFLENKGVINCYEFVKLLTRAKPIQDENYMGEAYYLDLNRTAEIISFTPNKIRLKIDVTDPVKLVINQNFHSGWRVKNHEVIPYNGLISTTVYPSDNVVEFYYLPFSFLLGLFLTIIGLVFVILFYFNKKLRDIVT